MKKILFVAALAALCASCSDGETCESDRHDQIALSAAIAEVAADETRTGFTGSSAAWASGDVIGVFCTQASAVNVPFTAAGAGASATWTSSPAIYWLDGLTTHKFLAYYPYASGNNDPAAVKIPALNAQTGTLSPAQDFMLSNNQNTTGVLRSGGAVALTFTHAFSLVELKVQLGNGLAAGTTLTNAVLAGGASEKLFTSDANSTIALSTGTITAGTTANTLTAAPATAPTLSATPTSLYILLLPGTYVGPTLTLSIKDGGTTSYTTAAQPLGTLAFLPGTKYSYTVTVSRNAIAISNPTITDWTTVTGTPLNPTI